MKKFLFFISVILFLNFHAVYAAEVSQLSAKAAILIDADSGRILFQKDCYQRLPQASTTKITTALLAFEIGDLKQEINIPADFVNPGEAGIWLEPGETHTLEDLLYALLLRSANDAAKAIAIGLGGSESSFVDLMNERVKLLGLKDTHYQNPHGLNAENHYSSAYDLAMLAREAMKNPQFCKFIQTRSHELPWAGHENSRVVYNRNQLLNLYQGATGVKTGSTKQAGSCLVGSATRNNLNLIAVVLHSDQMYQEVGALLDYGFNNYQKYQAIQKDEIVKTLPVAGGKADQLNVLAQQTISIPLTNEEIIEINRKIALSEMIKAPIQKGEVLGKLTIQVSEENSYSTNLIAGESIEKKPGLSLLWDKITNIFDYFLAMLIN